MSSSVSVRGLRNTVSAVLRRVEQGERITVTVDRRPVAELVPLSRHGPVSIAAARSIAQRHPMDRGLLEELRSVVSDTTDDT